MNPQTATPAMKNRNDPAGFVNARNHEHAVFDLSGIRRPIEKLNPLFLN
jgi:hypothetical protein